jgi:hypothetical protein
MTVEMADGSSRQETFEDSCLPSREGDPKLPRPPEEPRTARVVVFSLFAFALAYLWLFHRHTALDPDEGIILQGAQRILQGGVLYRDFFSFVTPGSYYFFTLLFKIFGSSLIILG